MSIRCVLSHYDAQCLLARGAVLTRDFAQTVFREYSNTVPGSRGNSRRKGRRHTPHWPNCLSIPAFAAILIEADSLYGKQLKLKDSMTDAEKFKEWADSTDRQDILEDDIKELMTVGKYAPYYRDYHDGTCQTPARHFDLFEMFEANGVIFKDKELCKVWVVMAACQSMTLLADLHYFADFPTCLKISTKKQMSKCKKMKTSCTNK